MHSEQRNAIRTVLSMESYGDTVPSKSEASDSEFPIFPTFPGWLSCFLVSVLYVVCITVSAATFMSEISLGRGMWCHRCIMFSGGGQKLCKCRFPFPVKSASAA